MTVSQPPFVETMFRVGRRWRVRMAIPRPIPGSALVMNVEWEPAAPGRRLNKREMADYRRGRAAALAEVAQLIGGNVLCIEAGLARWSLVSEDSCGGATASPSPGDFLVPYESEDIGAIS